MSALNLAVTQDQYVPVATLTCTPTNNLTVLVNNATVYYQLFVVHGSVPGRPGSQSVSDVEKILLPGYWNFGPEDFQGGQCVGIQFRSALPGTPATVSAYN